MNKQGKFEIGRTVISGNLIGEIIGIKSFQGVITNLQVKLINKQGIKYFKPYESKLVEFDQDSKSNKYLESLIKGKKEQTPANKLNTRVLTTDELLDRYNDYKVLFEMFGDRSYYAQMKVTLKQLEYISQGHNLKEIVDIQEL